ncbi:hypothetical protein [Hoylesella timonensis]|uniref:Uncharacterized protein n=1 Tax=Hoylesella timonensis TaxID=386414 RepID=A0A2N6Q7U3_9BACT|nr:hypothetical protein [Hoylesella timonensis]PMC10992.1 hypothetical protein CJ232_02565 [Hoylesella timonensis]
MKYYSQYRNHDLFELQESLSGLSKFMEKPVFVPELFVLVRKRLDYDFCQRSAAYRKAITNTFRIVLML